MDVNLLLQKYTSEEDIVKLRAGLVLLIKCLKHDQAGSGYCVVNEHNQVTYYWGSRENCVAFAEGYSEGYSGRSSMCVCVDTLSKTIVIPEERFGEELFPGGGE